MGWTKHFVDGTTELGSDYLVESGQASWSRGRLENIERVNLRWGSTEATIEGPGEYWQFDVYEATMGVNEGRLVSRTICRKLIQGDRFLLHSRPHLRHMKIEVIRSIDACMILDMDIIEEDQIGKWLFIEITPRSMTWRIGDR